MLTSSASLQTAISSQLVY